MPRVLRGAERGVGLGLSECPRRIGRVDGTIRRVARDPTADTLFRDAPRRELEGGANNGAEAESEAECAVAFGKAAGHGGRRGGGGAAGDS